jgi:hypothetical protein
MVTLSVDVSGSPLKLKITCGAGETDVTVLVQDIYEYWKNWVLASDNAKYLRAMGSEGNQPLGGGENLGSAFFLYTDNNWTIAPVTTETAVKIKLNGNLFPSIAGADMFNYAGVASKCFIELRTSTLPSAVETGVSGLTPTESSILSQIRTLCGLIPAAV